MTGRIAILAAGAVLSALLVLMAGIGVFVYRDARQRGMPPLPPEARTMSGWQLWKKVLWGMVPSVVLIFLVLGTIFMGLATPTEAGAMGAVGAMVLAAMHKRLTWPLVRQGMESTARITAMVIFMPQGLLGFLRRKLND